VYRAASPEDRQEAHRALADATDPALDAARRAWHLAQATPGFDEEVASELERSAGRAQARGGLAAAAAFLERAVALTPEPSRRAGRALAAAQAKQQSGAFEAAVGLLAIAESGPLDELRSARVDLLRGQIAFALSRGNDAPPLLLRAAKRLEPLDLRLARETYLEALTAVFFPGRLASTEIVLETARAARAAPPWSQSPRAPDLLLDGLALLITDGYAAGAPILRRAIDGFRDEEISRGEGRRWLWLASRVAAFLWDDESWDTLSARFVQLARDDGALSMLPLALTIRTGMHLFAGRLAMASSLVDELAAVNEATGAGLVAYAPVTLAAARGREPEAVRLIDASTREIMRRSGGQGLTSIHLSAAVLYNGLGRYEDALAAAQQAVEDSLAVRLSTWGLVELIEAAVRSRKAELAVDGLGQLSEMTAASGTDWALGVEARSRALLSDGEAAERLYRQAIERLEGTRVRVELARAYLLYGEWLRRQRRRAEARGQLRAAHELFTEFGMDAFAERARVELEATGEHARKRTVETRDDLTPQEAQVSRLAADGATNHEIAAQLFISRSTVDYHLRKAFRKLGVKSRHQLAQHPLEPRAHAEPPARGS
jgi:DNA-binding CsgD family transcriptional regulator